MISHGQATHDFFNLELRHHQYAEIMLNIIVTFITITAAKLWYLKQTTK